MADLEDHKRTVQAFYDLAFNQGRPQEAVDTYVGSRYTQHNPMAADGGDAFVGFVNGTEASTPSCRWSSSG